VTVGGTRPFKNYIKIITESCYNSKIENARNFTSLRKKRQRRGRERQKEREERGGEYRTALAERVNGRTF